MRHTAASIAIALSLSSGLSGCGWVQTNVVDPTAAFIKNPNTQLVATTVAQGTVVVICDISALAAVNDAVATAAQADQKYLGASGRAYAASKAACTGFGGLVAGTTTAPAGAAVVDTTKTS